MANTKLDINKFESIGESGPIDKWVSRFEKLANKNGTDNDCKALILRNYLGGEASKWYDHNSCDNWDELKVKLIDQFQTKPYMEIEYKGIRYLSSDGFSVFFQKKKQAADNAGISENKLVEDIYNDLPNEYAYLGLVTQPNTLEELREKGLAAENVIKNKKRKFTEVDKDEDSFCKICWKLRNKKFTNHTENECKTLKRSVNNRAFNRGGNRFSNGNQSGSNYNSNYNKANNNYNNKYKNQKQQQNKSVNKIRKANKSAANDDNNNDN
jgi:hypothetical protein